VPRSASTSNEPPARAPELLADLRTEAAARGGIVLVNADQLRLVHLATLIYLDDEPTIAFHAVSLDRPAGLARLRALAALNPTALVVDVQLAEAYNLQGRLPELSGPTPYGGSSAEPRFLVFWLE